MRYMMIAVIVYLFGLRSNTMNTAAMSDEVRRAISATAAERIHLKEKEALLHFLLADLVGLSFHERDGEDDHSFDPTCEVHL